ncbi:MAG: CRISPR-associated endonuclease Cas6 [Bacteroidota bacterium]
MQLSTLTFNFPLHAGEIRAFRAAIIGSLGYGHTLFNGFDNSIPGEQKYANTYPLVRYTVHKGRARIMGMGKGADAIMRHLLPVLPDQLLIGQRYCPTDAYDLRVKSWEPEILTEPYTFGLYRYLALNQKNYQHWKALESDEAARAMLLSSCLTGHLRALAETVTPELPRQMIEAQILKVDEVKRLQWHGNHFVGFNLVACANFIPPFGLGLGRCHSFGFGEVCGKRTYQHLAIDSKQARHSNRELA